MPLAEQVQVGWGGEWVRGAGVREAGSFFSGYSLGNMSLECKLPGVRESIDLLFILFCDGPQI